MHKRNTETAARELALAKFTRSRITALLLSVFLSFQLLTFAYPASALLPPLTAPPLGDRWFSISMDGEKVGFNHITTISTANGFRLISEGSAKMRVLGFLREASAHERYEVNRDLTLRSFEVEQTIDKSPLHISGTVSGRTIKVTVSNKAGKKEKTLKFKGALYPPPVANLYPLVKGFEPGRTYTMQMLDIEAVKVREVATKGIGVEKRNGLEVLHMRNDLHTFVDNDIWIDRAGNTIEESVRDGLIVTRAEEPAIAAGSLFEDAVAKKDLVLDFSLVRIDRELPEPEKLRRLVIDLSGYPENLPVPESPGQTATRLAPDRIRLIINTPLRQSSGNELSQSETSRYLSPTSRINSDHPEIIERQREILAFTQSVEHSVAILTRWVADYLDDAVVDSHSALEALQLRKGNCQTHARLYVAMARAAGIPSRMVSGLVYAKGKGFLYHSWAESYSGGWIALDPTFGQMPADISHIRLIAGDEPDDILPLAGIIGRVKADVVEVAP